MAAKYADFIFITQLDCTVRLWHVLVAAHGEQRQLPEQSTKTPIMTALLEEEQMVCMQVRWTRVCVCVCERACVRVCVCALGCVCLQVRW